MIGATKKPRLSPHVNALSLLQPPEILKSKVERSRRVLSDTRILNFYLETGPMALTGSTRMQASTVLMLVVGLALEYGRDAAQAFRDLRSWIKFLEDSSCSGLKSLILKEAETTRRPVHLLHSRPLCDDRLYRHNGARANIQSRPF